jgi:hypothetical protein
MARFINRAVANRALQCALCQDRRGQSLTSFVMSPGGGILCNRCVALLARAPTDEAVAVSRVHDVYRILTGVVPGQRAVELARDLSKQGLRLTHLHGHIGEPAVAAAMMKPHGQGPYYAELKALMDRGVPKPLMQLSLRCRCSFCHRNQRDSLILYYKDEKPLGIRMTLCAECHIVACDLLQRHGCLPEIRPDIRVFCAYDMYRPDAPSPPSNTCGFCDLSRDDDMLLRGPNRANICFRCVAGLLSQVRDDERNRECSYSGVTVQDYAFMSADELRSRTKDILKAGARWYPLTWTHQRKDATSTSMYRSPSGTRVRVRTDMISAPQAWITDDAATEKPPTDASASFHPGMPQKPPHRRCAFCHQDWGSVPGLGRGRRAKDLMPDGGALMTEEQDPGICYECIILANDTFEADGSVIGAASDTEDPVPVVWTPTDK